MGASAHPRSPLRVARGERPCRGDARDGLSVVGPASARPFEYLRVSGPTLGKGVTDWGAVSLPRSYFNSAQHERPRDSQSGARFPKAFSTSPEALRLRLPNEIMNRASCRL